MLKSLLPSPLVCLVVIVGFGAVLDPARAQLGGESSAPREVAESWEQTQADDFTRYELQAPRSNSFRILYDVTATTPGARLFFNAIRPGSEPTIHGVTDLATGESLRWKLVSGEEAASDGWVGAQAGMRYLRVELPRPVPELALGERSISPKSGEVRLRIDKTYRDEQSYRVAEPTAAWRGERPGLVFERSLGIRRNEVVLPAGYELVSLNTPSQIATESDGRLRVSFFNSWPGATAFELSAASSERQPPTQVRGVGVAKPEPVRGVGLPRGGGDVGGYPGAIRPANVGQRPVPGARVDHQPTSRARQDREIVYELLEPSSHAFRLWHDYTETRPGVDRYLNVVRPGSKASDPEAWDLDSGRRLPVLTLRGAAELAEQGVELEGPVTAATEVVLIRFEPVAEGGSRRIRIEETYTDPSRYGLVREEDGRMRLLWDRGFGRARNAVVLPTGWRLATSSIPATLATLPDGRTRLDFVNDRNDQIEVLIEAYRRSERSENGGR